MKRWSLRIWLAAFFVLAFPFRSPAPLIFTPGEGWTYEAVGGGAWRKTRAKDQLDVAQAAFDKHDYRLAKKASQRVVKIWPLSDYAPQAAYLLARCYEADHQDELAFKEYQKLLEKYPKAANYEEVLHRQFAICNRFLNGERFRLWGYIPTFPSMDKTVGLYDKVVKNGPYSDVAAQAQMDIGAAREKQTRFLNDKEPFILAAKAYETAADRYHNDPIIAPEALFRAGLAYQKQAETAEYDQSTAGQAISTFQQFMTLYPDDPRVTKGEQFIAALKTEQARGNFETAKYYESTHRWKSALIYYNAVVIQDPKSGYATVALERITALKKLTDKSGK
jgi:outer membrane protein assembly factor BamD (BamD/ComL family)